MLNKLKTTLRSVDEHLSDLERADPDWPFPHRWDFYESLAVQLEEAAAEVRRIRDETKYPAHD